MLDLWNYGCSDRAGRPQKCTNEHRFETIMGNIFDWKQEAMHFMKHVHR